MDLGIHLHHSFAKYCGPHATLVRIKPFKHFLYTTTNIPFRNAESLQLPLFISHKFYVVITKDVIDQKSDVRFAETQAIDLLTLKMKSDTVKPASKQVSPFQMLFTRPLVFFCLYLRNRVGSIRYLETLFCFRIWIANRSRPKFNLLQKCCMANVIKSCFKFLKLKFETVKPASKQVSPFQMLFTRPLVFMFVFAKPCAIDQIS